LHTGPTRSKESGVGRYRLRGQAANHANSRRPRRRGGRDRQDGQACRAALDRRCGLLHVVRSFPRPAYWVHCEALGAGTGGTDGIESVSGFTPVVGLPTAGGPTTVEDPLPVSHQTRQHGRDRNALSQRESPQNRNPYANAALAGRSLPAAAGCTPVATRLPALDAPDGLDSRLSGRGASSSYCDAGARRKCLEDTSARGTPGQMLGDLVKDCVLHRYTPFARAGRSRCWRTAPAVHPSKRVTQSDAVNPGIFRMHRRLSACLSNPRNGSTCGGRGFSGALLGFSRWTASGWSRGVRRAPQRGQWCGSGRRGLLFRMAVTWWATVR
jgi:hypothetical protein